jgi:predicted DNA-binding protein (MmcQ/YjbR family)
MEWWMNKNYWIKTMSGECCSTTELMGRLVDGSWEYALVQTAHGKVSLKALFKDGKNVE